MNTLYFWFSSLFVNIIYFGSFYLWHVNGIEGAGNLFVFIAWFAAIMYIIAGFGADKSLYKHKRPVGFVPYNYITESLAVFCLAWVGMFICAAVYAIGFLLTEGSRSREKSLL